MTDQVRPQFGELRHSNGDVVPLVAVETDVPDVFALRGIDGEIVAIDPTAGDEVWVDVIGPHQSVTIEISEETDGSP